MRWIREKENLPEICKAGSGVGILSEGSKKRRNGLKQRGNLSTMDFPGVLGVRGEV